MKVEIEDVRMYLTDKGIPLRVVEPVFHCTSEGRPVTHEQGEILYLPLFGAGVDAVDKALDMMRIYIENVAPVPEEWTVHLYRVMGTMLVGVVASDKYVEVLL
jgi:hypothetical protein